MCGFLVFAGRDFGPISHRALGHLRKRGPDGMGFWTGHGAVALHARLAIINPGDRGLQPIRRMTDVLLMNGEIYNWQELKEQGERTDSEVLLRVYQDEGLEGLKRLNGFWAFAMIRQNGSVHLVRDQFGVRPLYYTMFDGTLIAGSTLRSVVMQLPNRPPLNYKAMSEWARYQMVFGSHTFFEGVYRVLPGERVAVSKDGIVSGHQYEDIWQTGDRKPDDDWISEAQELLNDCVNEATTADVPFTSTCSGGLDSSVVTKLTEPGLAYHSNYSGKDFNETQHAKTVVESTTTRLFVHNANEHPDLVARVRDIVQDQDDLSVGSVVLPLDELMGEIGRRYRVTMLGTGGDELFGGYVRLDAAMGIMRDPGYAPTYAKLKRLNLASIEDRYEYLHRKGEHTLFRFFDEQAAVTGFNAALSWVSGKPFDSMYRFERTQFLPALLTIDDRIAGRHGVEGRPALLHQAFVRHVAQLAPAEISVRPLKDIAREVYAPWLPNSVLTRDDKKGFPTPVGAMVNENSAQLREYVTSSKHRDLFSLANLRWTTENPYDRGLFGLLQLTAWLESFNV